MNRPIVLLTRKLLAFIATFAVVFALFLQISGFAPLIAGGAHSSAVISVLDLDPDCDDHEEASSGEGLVAVIRHVVFASDKFVTVSDHVQLNESPLHSVWPPTPLRPPQA